MTNVVDFGERVGQLRVTALASTPSRPMEGFVPRRGDGKFFGLNILGVSQTEPPKVPKPNEVVAFFCNSLRRSNRMLLGHHVCAWRRHRKVMPPQALLFVLFVSGPGVGLWHTLQPPRHAPSEREGGPRYAAHSSSARF